MLILVLVLPVASWVLASKVHDRAPESRLISAAKTGPWGDLECVRIAIELPDNYIDIKNIETNDWFFPGLTKNEVLDFLHYCELSPEQIADLSNSSWETFENGIRVYPSDDYLWSLTPKSRAKIYGALAEFEGNVDQANAFAYRPDLLEERLAYSGLSEESIRMFKQLLYPDESLLRFADVDIVLRKIKSDAERLRFVKTVSRRCSLLVKLVITPKTDIEALLKYWGGGGRAKDLRPLLESLARVPGGTKIDIAHLLPPFVRQRIYTYPSPPVGDETGQQDCHWTSINFWSDNPRPVLPNPEAVANAIDHEYAKIGESLSEAQLGDIVFLENKDGVLIHSAVFIADDIVFTKNGAGANQPWIYMKMEDMMPFYSSGGEHPKTVIYRRKSN